MSTVAVIPRFVVEINGLALSPEDLHAVSLIRVQQRLSTPTQCEVTIQNPSPAMFEASRLAAGAKLSITAGENASLFDGEVTAMEYSFEAGRGRVIRLRGYDLLHRLRKRQPIRAFAGMTAYDLARELVADLSYFIQAPHPGPIWQKLFQRGQSDFEFLVEVCQWSGLYLTLREEILHLTTLEGIGDPIPLELGTTLLDGEVEVNSDASCREVTTSAWDPSRVEPRTGKATSARLGRTAGASAAPSRVGSNGERTIAGDVLGNDSQAEAIAQGELDFRAAGEVTFHGTADGNAHLRPGTPVKLSGLSESLNGVYVLTAVVHQIDRDGGYLSEIFTAPPAPRSKPAGAVVAWGVVKSVADPDCLARVRVAIPSWGAVESDWLAVVTAGAGAGKGMMSLPDVNDHVLVLFANDSRAQGLVIGGLFGVNAPPDQGGVVGGAIKRYTLQTPGGQYVQLDDVKKSVLLKNADKSFVELTPDMMMLHASTPITIEAPGQTITIRAKNVDFQNA